MMADSRSVDLLRVHGSIFYTIPSFNVISVKLKHVVVGVWDEKEDKLKHYDAYLHESSPEVIPEVPTTIEILESCNIKVNK